MTFDLLTFAGAFLVTISGNLGTASPLGVRMLRVLVAGLGLCLVVAGCQS